VVVKVDCAGHLCSRVESFWVVHYQIQIAVMMDLGLRTPLMMNLSKNWAILVRILMCLLPHNFGNNVLTVEELTDEELA
jgi:hypothetical protein